MTRPASVSSSWRPVLAGEACRQALAAVDAIAAELPGRLAPPQSQAQDPISDLSSGALFFTYLGRATGQGSHGRTAQALLETAIDLAGDAEKLRMSLFHGAAGLAWTIHHVGRLLGIESAEEATRSLDEELLDYLQSPGRSSEPYDLMDGLVGLGVYGFESGNRPLVQLVVHRLAERAQDTGDGLTWHTGPDFAGRSSFPEGHFNLGLAHGIAGLIAFLASTLEAGIEEGTAWRLLRGAVRWLWRQRLAEGDRHTFPWAVAPGTPPLSWGHDPGWAYADSGIAAALCRAACTLGDEGLFEAACSVAEREAMNLAELPVRNPGIGFGPAGYAQIFAHFYHQTGRPVFRRAAQESIHALLDLRTSDLSFLRGATGIGLVLLAAVSEVDPLWDRLLLLSSLPGTPSALRRCGQ